MATSKTPSALAPTAAQPADDLLADTEAAAYLHVAVQTVRNWRWKRTGPKWSRIGQRIIRYRRSDLDAFIARGASDREAAA